MGQRIMHIQNGVGRAVVYQLLRSRAVESLEPRVGLPPSYQTICFVLLCALLNILVLAQHEQVLLELSRMERYSLNENEELEALGLPLPENCGRCCFCSSLNADRICVSRAISSSRFSLNEASLYIVSKLEQCDAPSTLETFTMSSSKNRSLCRFLFMGNKCFRFATSNSKMIKIHSLRTYLIYVSSGTGTAMFCIVEIFLACWRKSSIRSHSI